MVAVAVVAASVGVTGTGARRVLFMASDTCLAKKSEIFCKTDADKSESSRLSCMSASAAKHPAQFHYVTPLLLFSTRARLLPGGCLE